MNGVPMVGVVVIPQPGANHIEIANAVYDRMEKMKKDLPEDVHYNYGFDNTKFIRASIDEVKQTVYEAFVLVIIIIFLFLRDWRVTLVPCIVIPVSLIGAFFVMYLAGFSINVLSMLAVVLAVGLVVDDAIVMTENIYVRIEKGMPPQEAGIEGAKEIFFAVISTTITLVSVFFPIVFMDCTTGRLFREFSIVVSGSVIISSFAALTFTPMLDTKLLIKREQQSWFYRKTEPFFEGMNRVYSQSLAAFLKRRWIALPFTIVTILLIGVLWNTIPAEMAPLEDRSQISINTMGAEGVTYEYIRDYTEDINHLVDSIIPDAEAVTARVSSGSGNVRITLKDMKDRDYTQMEVAEKLSKAVQKKTMARSFVQQSSSFGGRRGGMPVQYVLQATNIEKLQEALPKFMTKGYENPVFQMADVNLKFSKPEARININRDKASIMGVSTKNIAQTLQYFSSIGSENAFRRMLVLDALIVNTDRHKGNYGVLFQTDTLQPIKMAPVFDHNQSLLPYAMEDDFRDLDSYLSEKIPRIGTDFSETAAMVMTPDIRADLRNLQDFAFSSSENGLPKWRVNELNKLIVHQSRAILKSKKIYMSPDQPKKKNIKKATPRL